MAENKQQETLVDPDTLEDGVGVKGMQFDPSENYSFTVTDKKVRKIKKVDDKGHETGEFTVIDMVFQEQSSQVNIKQSFFYNKNPRINDDDLAHEDDAIKYARALGFKIGVDMPFPWKKIFAVGTTFTAHTRLRVDKKTKLPTNFSEIDCLTIKPVGAGAAKAQQSIQASDDDYAFVVEAALDAKNKTELIKKLNEKNRKDLVKLAINLDSNKELAYKE